MSVLPKAFLEVKALPLAVMVVAAYFLYWGVFGLGRIITDIMTPTSSSQVGDGDIVRHYSEIHPMHVAVVLTCIVGGGYGVSWGMSKLR